jgi:hypothetical protein
MITPLSRLAIALSAAIAICNIVPLAAAGDVGCLPRGVVLVYAPATNAVIDTPQPARSWVFKRSTFTNDPVTGARVAQYARKDVVEPLDDQRLVTSSYRRTRTVNNGRDGSMDTSYQVQAWGQGGGELGAQWQMFNDVWKEAILSGSFYNGSQAYGPWGQGGQGWGGGPGWGGGWNGGWNPHPWPHGGHPNSTDHWPSDDRTPLPYQE